MSFKFNNYSNVTKITIGNNVVCGQNFQNAFSDMKNLTDCKFPTNNIKDMSFMFYNCSNFVGNPVSGPNVVNMTNAYGGCEKMSGSPVCGPNVSDMYCAYEGCTKLSGPPVCGDKIINMRQSYRNCKNITGSPVCGPNVRDFSWAYANCYNITGSPVCGPNVSDIIHSYYNCYNLKGDAYFYSNGILNAASCFYGRNVNSMLNIHVYNINGDTIPALTASSAEDSITGANIAWTHDQTNRRYYNTAANIYIYYDL